MTLGEKIKTARKNIGLTQEELAVKLSVSRPAVAKWETDKGIPDIENLKAISGLLGVSLDSLLDDGDLPELDIIREPTDLSEYGKGFKKKLKDRMMKEKFPRAEIFTLVPEKVLTKGERVIDHLLGFLTDAPFGTADMFNSVKLLGSEYYIAVDGGTQYLVTVTNEYVESRRLSEKVDITKGSRFVIGDMRYTVCGPIL